MLSLRGLLCVISGLLAGGSPGFRTVLCCLFSHKSCMASLFCYGSLFPCCLVALAIPILVNAKQFSFAVCYMAPSRLQCFPCFGFCLLFLACFVSCLFCCVSCLVSFSVSLHYDGLGLCTGPSSALFLRPIINKMGQLNALINGTCCMPIERVDRPGESQQATGGKKIGT